MSMHGLTIWSQYFGDMPSNKFYIQSELARCLEDNDFRGFEDALESAVDIGYDLNESYGKEVGYKTILHLALDEDDHDTTRYIKVTFEKSIWRWTNLISMIGFALQRG